MAPSLLPDLAPLSVDQLAALVAHHNRRYWDMNDPEISDYDYDVLVEALRARQSDHPVLSHLGPTLKTADGVKHRHPMLSLDKCYGDEELDKWAASFAGPAVMMPKYDGIACSLHYNSKGQLVLAATRGDGVTGDDITANVKEIDDVPKTLPAGTAVEVRGEVFLRLSRFAKFKAEGMANPRNAAAGAIKQKDPKKSAAYGLSFAAYDLLGHGLPTHHDELEWLVSAGFAPIDYEVLDKPDLRAGYQRMALRRPGLDYEIDGVVFKTDRSDEQDRLGATAHHPRYALAYKFQGDSGTSFLRAVEWSVARTGAITPVAVVDPVSLSGVTVTRASLHHPGFIQKLGLTLGAEVVMMRRGGVIPNVEFVSKPGDRPVDLPAVCPSCGAGTRVDGDFLYCAQPRTCKAVVIGLLSHYASAVDMLGFGDVVLELAYEKGILRTPADFYALTPAMLGGLDRVGDKTAVKLCKEVDKKRALELPTFLRALGLPELGKNVSKILAEKFGTLDAILGLTEADLAAQYGIGDSIARTVVAGLRDAAPLITALRAVVTLKAPAPSAAGAGAASGASPGGAGPFAGMTFVFTGKMASLERKAAEDEVAQLGGTALDAVNKALTYLVVGDLKKPGEKSSKEKAADKHVAAGAPLTIISESDFIKLVAAARAAAPAPAVSAAPAPAVEAPTEEAVEAPAPATPTPAPEPEPVVEASGPPVVAAPVEVAPPLGPVVVAPTGPDLRGTVLTFAGKLAAVTLGEATRRVEALGGVVADAVGPTSTHLVVGNKGKAGEPLSVARRMQAEGHPVQIVDEGHFATWVGLGQMTLFG